jgi:hypothetical protein
MLTGDTSASRPKIEAGSRWKRRKLIKGERRFAVVLRIEHTIGGHPLVIYKYTRALKDGYGNGLCVLPPRRNSAYMSPEKFLKEFEPEIT